MLQILGENLLLPDNLGSLAFSTASCKALAHTTDKQSPTKAEKVIDCLAGGRGFCLHAQGQRAGQLPHVPPDCATYLFHSCNADRL